MTNKTVRLHDLYGKTSNKEMLRRINRTYAKLCSLERYLLQKGVLGNDWVGEPYADH